MLLLLFPLIAYGGYRFVQALLTGVIQINRTVKISRADEPGFFAFNVSLVGVATAACVWMLMGALGSMHISIHTA